MPNEERFNETLLFDPDRLKYLAQRLSELQQSDPSADVDTVLSGLDSTTQSLYREPLRQYVSGDTQQDNKSFRATNQFDTPIGTSPPTSSAPGQPPETPNQLRADATLDVSEAAPARPVVDLPPAPRPPRQKDGASGSGENKSVNKLPETIGKFEIKGELGRGAFGVVYLGFDRELQRNVAIKLSLVSDKKIQERLRVEASKAAQIESEGIVPVYHIGNTEEGATYIVQKYIQGSTLRDILDERGPLSPFAGVRLIREIAVALEPAHLRDILHRDLKPDNILIDHQARPWIADFGLAISEEEQQGRRGELAGTPAYMSPEQIKGRIDFLDPRSDIWSLGVMFYELLSGKLPFNGRDRRALAEQICELDPRPLHQRSPLLSEAVNSVFLRCCAKKPADRFASVRELTVALDQLIAEGLSDQNVHSSAAVNMFGDSTLLPDSTLTRRGASDGTRRSSHHDSGLQGSNQRVSSQQVSTQRDTNTHRDSSRESIGSVNSSTSETITPAQASLHHSSPWWMRSVLQLLTLAAMVAMSVIATKYFLGLEPSKPITDSGSTVATTTNPAPNVIAPDTKKETLPELGGGIPNIGETKAKPTTTAPSKPRLDVDGSPEKPWVVNASGTGSHSSIQAAIDAGPSGATIRVQPGVYEERLRITRPVTIIGEKDLGICELKNAEGPPITIQCNEEGVVQIRDLVIDAQGHSSTIPFNAIDVESGALAIQSSSLRTSSQNCIKAYKNTSISAIDCQFLESREFAISALDHKNVIVDNCLFRLSGVQLVGGPGTISSSKFFGKEGVYSDRSRPGKVDVSNCNFVECVGYGVSATNDAIVSVSNCTFKDCKFGAQAVFSDESDVSGETSEVPGSISLSQSTFVNCRAGIEIVRGEMTLSDNCKITGGLNGVQVSGGRLTMENSSITDISDTGVVVIQGGVVSLTRTQIEGSRLTGIVISDGTLSVTGGSVSNSVDVGVYLEEKCVSANFDGVEFKNNRACSVFVIASGSKINIARSRFSGGNYGIQISAKDGRSQLGIQECIFDALTSNAIYASGKVHVKFKDCDFGTIPQEKQVGVYQSAIVEKIVDSL